MAFLKYIENSDSVPLYAALHIISKGTTKLLEDNLKDADINPTEVPYIVQIYLHNGKITQKDLSNHFQVSQPFVSKTLKNLEEKGYIISKKDSNKRSKKFLSLTEKGVDMSEKLFDIHTQWKEELFSSLNQEDIDKFNEILGILVSTSFEKFF